MSCPLRLRLCARYKLREQVQIRECVCVGLRVGPMGVGCAGCCSIFDEVESQGCWSFFVKSNPRVWSPNPLSFSLTQFFFLIFTLMFPSVCMLLRFRPGVQSGIKNCRCCQSRSFLAPAHLGQYQEFFVCRAPEIWEGKLPKFLKQTKKETSKGSWAQVNGESLCWILLRGINSM